MKPAEIQRLEARSLALHRVIAEKIRAKPELFKVARATLARHREIVSADSQPCLLEWERLFDQGMEAALAVATEVSERAALLRKSSPFAGILTERERWKIIRQFSSSGLPQEAAVWSSPEEWASRKPLRVLYLDFDGVLHPSEVWSHPTPPHIRLEAPGHELFESAQILERLLEPYPELQIVLSTSWVRVLGYDAARRHLTPGLQARVIGATFDPEIAELGVSRWYSLLRQGRTAQILNDVKYRRPATWLAIDDDCPLWPESSRDHMAHMPPALGLAEPVAQERFQTLLKTHFGAGEER